jgi:hypothetical protein
MNSSLTPQQRTAISRIAALTLANAMVFQEVASGYRSKIDPLRKTLESPDAASAFIDHWQFIMDNINYVPIFKVSRDILLALPADADIDKALRFLAERALDIVRYRAALRHDLMGRIYHRLLAEAKFLGTFYTSVPSATLLLKLTLNPKKWPEHQFRLNELESFKLSDLACGTGTLLMAAAEAIVDNYVLTCQEDEIPPDLKELHRLLMENIIYGYDVLASALHLTASTLALRAPDISFQKMHLYSLPLGGPHFRLGSVEFLKDRDLAVSRDLFGVAVSPGQVTGSGDISSHIASLPNLDVCVMNPPFTRSVGGNLLFGSLPAAIRAQMQKDLAKLLKTQQVSANSTAGLGSVFVAIGDRALKENGRMALVLPKALLSGVAWGETREIFRKHYQLEYIIASHDPQRWNFSENTDLSEVLVIGKKVSEETLKESTNVTCVNLWKNPSTSFESLAIAQLLNENKAPDIEQGQGALNLNLGQIKFGEAVSIPWQELKNNIWMLPSAFAQSDLIRAAHELLKGKIWLPGSNATGNIPLCPLHTLGELGPDRRDIHDGFEFTTTLTPYPVLWGHNADLVTTMDISANGYLSPLSEAKKGRHLRKVKDLWPKAGNVLFAERLWLKTQRLVAVHIDKNALSNVWWPFHFNTENQNKQKALSLWSNSTLGLIILLVHRVETRGAWIDFKKPILNAMPVLAVDSLEPEKLKALSDIYDKICKEEILPFPYMNIDPVRKAIDDVISQVLGLPDVTALRDMLAREPVVCLRPLE